MFIFFVIFCLIWAKVHTYDVVDYWSCTVNISRANECKPESALVGRSVSIGRCFCFIIVAKGLAIVTVDFKSALLAKTVRKKHTHIEQMRYTSDEKQTTILWFIFVKRFANILRSCAFISSVCLCNFFFFVCRSFALKFTNVYGFHGSAPI